MAIQMFSSCSLITFAILLFSMLIEARFLDKRTDNCFYGMRHRNIPSGGLVAKMTKWNTFNMKKGDRMNEHDCRGSFAGCQTYSCIDASGDQIFVVNSCAPDGGNCTHSDLDPFCAAEKGTPKCEICHKGLCNRHKVELVEMQQPMMADEKQQRQLTKSNESSADSVGGAGGEIQSDDPSDL
ncbi:hypothetical protein niasHT_005798 [Heterodera trifolii]|uniref:Effector protein n=1 Tax=Heterodera trifolii TaxID=157864 RepID=A0ABD2LTL0_9BILA